MGLFAEPLTKEEMYLNYLNGNGGLDNLPNPLTAVEKYLYNLCLNNSISDHSSSKYIDIGTVRIQWGRGGGGTYNPIFTFPVPFKDTSYSFTAMFNGGTATNQYTVIQIGTRTVSAQQVEKRFSGGAATGEGLDWIAIGVKP